MAKTAIHTGGCLCGAVRFAVEGPLERPHTCSCRMCGRHTGALTATWVEVPRERVRWTGTAGAPASWRSSERSSRAFCATCGSSIGSLDDDPVVALLTGVFDKPGAVALKPCSHSFGASRPRWWRVEVA